MAIYRKIVEKSMEEYQKEGFREVQYINRGILQFCIRE